MWHFTLKTDQEVDEVIRALTGRGAKYVIDRTHSILNRYTGYAEFPNNITGIPGKWDQVTIRPDESMKFRTMCDDYMTNIDGGFILQLHGIKPNPNEVGPNAEEDRGYQRKTTEYKMALRDITTLDAKTLFLLYDVIEHVRDLVNMKHRLPYRYKRYCCLELVDDVKRLMVRHEGVGGEYGTFVHATKLLMDDLRAEFMPNVLQHFSTEDGHVHDSLLAPPSKIKWYRTYSTPKDLVDYTRKHYRCVVLKGCDKKTVDALWDFVKEDPQHRYYVFIFELFDDNINYSVLEHIKEGVFVTHEYCRYIVPPHVICLSDKKPAHVTCSDKYEVVSNR